VFVAYRVVFAVVVGACCSSDDLDVMKRMRQQRSGPAGPRDIRTQQELVAALRDRGFRANAGDREP